MILSGTVITFEPIIWETSQKTPVLWSMADVTSTILLVEPIVGEFWMPTITCYRNAMVSYIIYHVVVFLQETIHPPSWA